MDSVAAVLPSAEKKFCYYHHSTRKPVADPRQRQARRNRFLLPTPGSRDNIQNALGQVLTRIASNDIDPRRAGLLLYALQIACTNLTHNTQEKQSPHIPHPQAQQPTAPSPEEPTATSPVGEHESTPDPSETQDVIILVVPCSRQSSKAWQDTEAIYPPVTTHNLKP